MSGRCLARTSAGERRLLGVSCRDTGEVRDEISERHLRDKPSGLSEIFFPPSISSRATDRYMVNSSSDVLLGG